MKKIFTLLTAILLSVSTYAYYWGDDASYAYSVSNATYTATSISNVRKIQANVTQVGYAGCLDFMTSMFFVVPEECGYVPTGVYNISSGSEPFQQGTVIAGNGYSVHQVSDWCNGGSPDYYPDYFSSGTVIVFNPNKTPIPSYILASFTTLKGWEHTVTIGTEPTIRTVTFNNDADANGNTFAVTANPFCADNGCTTFYQGTEITLTPQPASGFTLNSWTGTGAEDITSNGDGTYTLIVGAKDYNISATWTELSGGAITAVASPAIGGSVVVDPTGWQAAGTAVTLTPSANPNYAFTGWQDGGNDNPRTVYVNGDASYTALFVPTHTITVTSANASQGSVSGGGVYPEGAVVNISATGLNGYAFSQWTDGNTSNPRSITVGNTDASYTAEFILPGMTVVSCSSGTGISFHCDYSDITDHHKCTENVEGNEDELYYVSSGYIYFANTIAIKATNSQNNSMTLYLTSRENNTTRKYSGGECNNVNGPEVQTYPIYLAKLYYTTNYCNSGFYSVNDNSVSYSTVAYQSNTCGSYSYSTTYYSKITYNGTEYKLRTRAEGDGVIKVNENNVGGIFIESEYVQDYNRSNNIYFTLGNRSENTVNLGTGTMSVTPSTLTMSASNGNHSASIKLNNNTTGNKTLSDFSIANCSFVYNGTSITEISDMTGTVSSSVVGGVITYTMNLKIRDCQQNLYKVSMSAVAPSFTLGWNANGKSLTGGTAAGSVQFSAAITAPTSNTTGYTVSSWLPAFTGTMPAQNVTYTAQWTPTPYNITYYQNGGSGATNSTYNIESEDITLPTADDMSKENYIFAGWYDNENLEGDAIETIAAGSTGNKVFWAKWNLNGFMITFNDYNGTQLQSSAVVTNQKPTIASPTRADDVANNTAYTFAGWKSSVDDQIYTTENLPVATAEVT